MKPLLLATGGAIAPGSFAGADAQGVPRHRQGRPVGVLVRRPGARREERNRGLHLHGPGGAIARAWEALTRRFPFPPLLTDRHIHGIPREEPMWFPKIRIRIVWRDNRCDLCGDRLRGVPPLPRLSPRRLNRIANPARVGGNGSGLHCVRQGEARPPDQTPGRETNRVEPSSRSKARSRASESPTWTAHPRYGRHHRRPTLWLMAQ